MEKSLFQQGEEVVLTDGSHWIIDAISEENGTRTYTLRNPKNGEKHPASEHDLRARLQ
ncbi:hypothetical protein TUM12370_21310 [Salmonella enterica subsp. enterica serovar Choleraesuis]|nr:hypothetical protein TUM12370_21310 [Salmonella enterica subsp. enterica serovar Choleraesuis]